MGLDAVYDMIRYSAGNNAVQSANAAVGSVPISAGSVYAVGNSLAQLAANQTVTHTLAGATYQALPTLKLHGGYGTTTSGDNSYQTRSTQVGATYTMGQWDFMALDAQVQDNGTTNTNRSLLSTGLNYNLSKTTRTYLRYETVNWNTATSFTGSQQTRYAIGLSTNF
jgi:predicted porin